MSKFSCVFFPGNLTNKTVTRTAYTWELLIAKHLDQSLWSTNQNNWAPVRSNLLHSFLEVHNCVAPFTRHGNVHEFGAEKPISWPNRHILTFSQEIVLSGITYRALVEMLLVPDFTHHHMFYIMCSTYNAISLLRL